MISEDREILAAEYALGTLDESERAQAATLAQVNDEFASRMHYWEKRLATLTEMVHPVEPPAAIWDKITARIRGEASGNVARESVVASTVAASPNAGVAGVEPAKTSSAAVDADDVSPATNGGADIINLTARLHRWRTATYVAGALAATLLLFVAVREASPPRLTEEAGRFVAVLQRDAVSPGFLLTVDLKTKNFTVRRVGADAPAERSYELWLVHDKFPQPRSLGVIGDKAFTRAALSDYDQKIINEATYAVSLEPQGGSPTGVATGPIVYVGKLVEAVP